MMNDKDKRKLTDDELEMVSGGKTSELIMLPIDGNNSPFLEYCNGLGIKERERIIYEMKKITDEKNRCRQQGI